MEYYIEYQPPRVVTYQVHNQIYTPDTPVYRPWLNPVPESISRWPDADQTNPVIANPVVVLYRYKHVKNIPLSPVVTKYSPVESRGGQVSYENW